MSDHSGLRVPREQRWKPQDLQKPISEVVEDHSWCILSAKTSHKPSSDCREGDIESTS